MEAFERLGVERGLGGGGNLLGDDEWKLGVYCAEFHAFAGLRNVGML